MVLKIWKTHRIMHVGITLWKLNIGVIVRRCFFGKNIRELSLVHLKKWTEQGVIALFGLL